MKTFLSKEGLAKLNELTQTLDQATLKANAVRISKIVKPSSVAWACAPEPKYLSKKGINAYTLLSNNFLVENEAARIMVDAELSTMTDDMALAVRISVFDLLLCLMPEHSILTAPVLLISHEATLNEDDLDALAQYVVDGSDVSFYPLLLQIGILVNTPQASFSQIFNDHVRLLFVHMATVPTDDEKRNELARFESWLIDHKIGIPEIAYILTGFYNRILEEADYAPEI